MRSPIYSIIFLLIFCSIGNATTPTISTVTGTVATGQTLTLTGTNMINENNANWRPLFKTSAYSFEGSTPALDGYLNGGGVYDSTIKLLGSKSIRFHVSGASTVCPNQNLGDYVYTNEAGQTDYWVRGYVRYESANNLWASTHFKMFDLQDGTPPNTYVQWTPSTTLPTSMRVTKNIESTNVDAAIPSGTLQNDRWYLVEIHQQSTMVTVWLDGVQLISTSKTANNLDFFNLGVVNCCGTTSAFNLYHWMDGVTISSSRVYAASTIEVSGDGSTWKYQTPISLSETSSQVKLDLSGLTGTSYRIRVKNNLQETSAVYMLSGGSGDVTPPSVPANLSATASSSSQINLSWSASSDDTGVTGYKIYRSGIYLTTTAASPYAVTGLTQSTLYSFTISAVDAAGNESAQTSAVSATTQNGTGGVTTIFYESFDNNSFASRGWYDNTNHGTIVSGGQSGNCLQWAWPINDNRPTNGLAMRKQFTATDKLYVSVYMKFQAGWRGSQLDYHPHMIMILSDIDDSSNDGYPPTANNYLNNYIEFISGIGGSYPIRPSISIQDEKRVTTSYGTPYVGMDLTTTTENRSVAACNTAVPSGAIGLCYADDPYYSANTWTDGITDVSKDYWHHIEVYFQMNSISGGKGQSDGIMQEWIDGNLVINKNNVLYRTNQDATKKWAQFVLGPWISNGITGGGSPIAQTMWLDELTVGTAAPGQLSGAGQVRLDGSPVQLNGSPALIQ